MNRRDSGNLGDEIKDIIQDVLNTNNFNRLNHDIGRTVNSALSDMENMFGGKSRRPDPDSLWEPLAKEEPPMDAWDENPQQKKATSNYEYTKKQNLKPQSNATIAKSPPGNVAGILLIIFGFLGVGIMGISLLVSVIATAVIGMNTIINTLAFGGIPLLVISGVMAGKGIQLRKRVNRFRRYTARLNGRNYCSIKELAKPIGKSEKFVASDLKKMIHVGMFPQGHIDEKQTCFMLDDVAYKQYLETEKWVKEQQELEAKQKREMAQKQKSQENEDEGQRALRNTIEEGKGYIQQIRKANDDIPGEEVSKKLDRLEEVTSKIFKHIETHPEQISEIRKFMNYYLPTTLKLTNAYSELDKQPAMGENISTAKNEIQKTLDTINSAFENLLDDLFYHAAMDISSDISVLETMLAQEGLTDKDFTKK